MKDAYQVVTPDTAPLLDMPFLPTLLYLSGESTDGRFSIVIHTVPPKTLAAPPHRHRNEDEYSFVLEGEMGAMLGDDFVTAGPGTLVVKPRGQLHAFWNAGDVPCRLVEIISASGFEEYFVSLGKLPWLEDFEGALQEVGRISAEYGLEFEWERTGEIVDRFGLNPMGPPNS
jgi:mannose-6-phosphate isomerase-like protein (cupin superfamily)